jgi:hypothetical protein
MRRQEYLSTKVLGTLHRILIDAAELKGPGVKMITAVIARAVIDCKSDNIRQQERRDAVDFVTTDRLDRLADAIGLEGDYVRRLARNGGYIE